MKKTLMYLLLVHIASTASAFITGASIYTMMYLYACQSVIFLIVLTFQSLKTGHPIFKIMSFIQFLIFVVFFGGIFFLLVKLPTAPIVSSNGTERILDLGALHLFPVIFGSLLFVVNYVISAKNNVTPQFKSDMARNLRYFLTTFVNIASLIIILVTAAMFESSKTSILIIGAIKATVDIGLTILVTATLRLDGPLSKITSGFGKV